MLPLLTCGTMAGCASIAGLDQYAGSITEDASMGPPVSTSEVLDATGADQSAAPEVGWGGTEVSADELTPADDATDAPVAAMDAGDASSPDVGRGNGAADATSEALVEQLPEASVDASDARPMCTRSTCGGCCTAAGDCVGGQSVATCGTKGATCADCTQTGQSCNGGVCSSAPHDAGTCTMLSCTTLSNLCIPVWQQPCCKSDETCGCYITIPTGPCR